MRSLEAFARFLEVAALANAQVTNVASLARDAAVARPTVQGYFEVLTDTLIGAWLPAWRPRAKVKETSHPKFYLFDCGVARALAGACGSRSTPPSAAPSSRRSCSTSCARKSDTRARRRASPTIARRREPRSISSGRAGSGGRHRSEGERALAAGVRARTQRVARPRVLSECVAVYLGERPLQEGAVRVLPLRAFARELAGGRVLRRALTADVQLRRPRGRGTDFREVDRPEAEGEGRDPGEPQVALREVDEARKGDDRVAVEAEGLPAGEVVGFPQAALAGATAVVAGPAGLPLRRPRRG